MELRGRNRLLLYLLLAFTLISISTAAAPDAAAHDGRKKKQVPIKQEAEEEVVLARLGEGVGSEEEVDDQEEEEGRVIPEPEPEPRSGKAESTSIEIPGNKKEGGRVDPNQALVDKALAILRKIDPSATRYRTSRTSFSGVVGGHNEAPRGVLGYIGHYLKRLSSLILLHNPASIEEPVDSSAPRWPGGLREGRHVRQLRAAVEALDEAARGGHEEAIYLLAQINFYGNWSHPRSYKKAFEWYKKLADKNGNATAQHMVGFMYATGVGGAVERDQAKALLHHTFAALNGNIPSEMTVAFRHHTGIGAPRNCDNAAYHYKQVADKAMEYWRSGPPGGRYTVRHSYRLADDEGGVYGDGASYMSSGINKPKSRAHSESAKELEDILEYWDLLSRKGNLFATFTLGKMYYEGSRHMPRNLAKAKAYFMAVANKYWAANGKVLAGAPQGAEKWAAQAAGQMGKMYLRGDGVKQNFEKAVMWFERGVVKGDYYSQNGLGFMYLHGYGKPTNLKKAVEYFDAAANQDFAPAQVNLGKILLEQGDYADAIKYFELAARHGNVESYYYLAEIYNSGKGRERSCGMATAYYKIVAERIEAIHSPFEWANKAYAEGDVESALVGYMMAAEQGYESAQQNVAFILDDQKSRLPLLDLLNMIKTKTLGLASTASSTPVQEQGEGKRGEMTTEEQARYRNRELALIYYTRSAKQANIDSLVKMGDYYLSGIGTELDHEKAAACYQAASEFQQSAQALWNLGWMHENGVGVEQDFHLAKRFYDLALDTNPSEAYLPVVMSLVKLRVRGLVEPD
ncbi:HCP-like protein [Terfezia boudieri ATCC MYA-4762]|uniref:HCP-like protein n=1 Tax=Terfezia boudieri ATCC MYA-4762 TaxID=1051890 RepID=A0A3N4LM47_9PEZI|nr:HCP-like protein [Terfezia boudieri ATCC MYA-4762]